MLTAWEVTAACVRLGLWASAARATSTSACLTPVTPTDPTTVYSSSTTSAANAARDTPVQARIGQHMHEHR